MKVAESHIVITNDKLVCSHRGGENPMQMVCQVLAVCFEDNCTDKLPTAPVSNVILEKMLWYHSRFRSME